MEAAGRSAEHPGPSGDEVGPPCTIEALEAGAAGMYVDVYDVYARRGSRRDPDVGGRPTTPPRRDGPRIARGVLESVRRQRALLTGHAGEDRDALPISLC